MYNNKKTNEKIKLYDRIHTLNTHKPIDRIQFIENGFSKSLKNKYKRYTYKEEEGEEEREEILRRDYTYILISFSRCIYYMKMTEHAERYSQML